MVRRPGRPPRIGAATATVLTVAVLVLTNLLNNRWLHGWGLVVSPVVTLLLLGLWRWSGGSWAGVGLGPGTWARGLRWAGALIGLVALVYLVGALVPVTRDLFADQRTSVLSGGQIAYRVLVEVPFGTVLLEETAFRGVLYGLIRRLRGTVAATVGSSLLFGLWHILPSLHLASDKPALTSLLGNSVAAAAVADAGAVLFTAASGVLFCELRRRSGSLLAPMGLHWATNALGYLAAFLLR
ncbi:CPBP family intramembrane glutamic endopeptidase [Streptacidiphilus monticola]|uniref:CPBP family intramembrane glutamic endopeptidase n=1 Tax=Streptacidiphilus monticola TaxID=2161674 RepID=A0ABW1G379_9ACTN